MFRHRKIFAEILQKTIHCFTNKEYKDKVMDFVMATSSCMMTPKFLWGGIIILAAAPRQLENKKKNVSWF